MEFTSPKNYGKQNGRTTISLGLLKNSVVAVVIAVVVVVDVAVAVVAVNFAVVVDREQPNHADYCCNYLIHTSVSSTSRTSTPPTCYQTKQLTLTIKMTMVAGNGESNSSNSFSE